MDPTFSFDADYDAPLVRRSAWRFARRRFAGDRRLWTAFLGAEAFVLAWWAAFRDPWMLGFAAGLPLLVAGLFAAAGLSHAAAGLRKMRALDAGRARFTLDRERLSVATRAGSVAWAWAAVEEVWTGPDAWTVALAVNSYLTLPTAAAPPGALDFARSRLAEHGIPVRED